MSRITVEGLNQAAVLQSLWKGAKRGWFSIPRMTPSLRECEHALRFTKDFETFRGRRLGIKFRWDIIGWCINGREYDKMYGEGAAKRAVRALRKKALDG